MAALQDSLTNLGQFQIPRPKCVGMEFVTIRGSHSGFYRSINKSVALKYGIRNGLNGKRPTIPENWIGQGEKTGNGRMGKAKGGMIPEEPEMEPTPDYEMGEENRGKSSERIAVPIGSAPPAPPLLPEFRQSLLKKNRQSRQNGKENLGRNHFELMAAGGQKFVGAFWKKEQQNGMGNGEMGSIKL